MKKLTESLLIFESSPKSNVYLVVNKKQCILIDTGPAGKADFLIKEMVKANILPSQISDIVLTHHSADHTGNIARLQKFSGAKVWAHQADIKQMLGNHGGAWYQRLRGVITHADSSIIKGKIKKDTTKIGFIKVLPAPTDKAGQTLFAWKDALFTGDAVTIKPDGRIVPCHTEVAPAIMQKVLSKSVGWVCPAHGKPFNKYN